MILSLSVKWRQLPRVVDENYLAEIQTVASRSDPAGACTRYLATREWLKIYQEAFVPELES